MNGVHFLGRVSGTPYFTRIEGKQPFLCFYLQLPGPRPEPPSYVRVVVFGEDAERLYPRLYPEVWAAVEGRYRVRENPKAVARAEAVVATVLQETAQIAGEGVARAVVAALRDKLAPVPEVVATPNKVTVYRLSAGEAEAAR